MQKATVAPSATVLALATADCASTLIGDEVIAERTSFALGLNKSDFTINNRSDDASSTRYQVRTKTGQEFNCSVGVTVSVLGRQVTHACAPGRANLRATRCCAEAL